MTNPFAKRKVTAQEREAILAEARKTWDSLEHSHILGFTDVQYLESVDDGLEVVRTQFVAPEPLSPERSAEQTREIETEGLLHRVFGGRADREEIPSWFKKTHEAEQRAALEKLLGPTRQAEGTLDELVKDALSRVLAKSGGDFSPGLRIRPVPARQSLSPILKAASEFCENPDLSAFLSAFAQNDEAGMRVVVREMEAA